MEKQLPACQHSTAPTCHPPEGNRRNGTLAGCRQIQPRHIERERECERMRERERERGREGVCVCERERGGEGGREGGGTVGVGPACILFYWPRERTRIDVTRGAVPIERTPIAGRAR